MTFFYPFSTSSMDFVARKTQKDREEEISQLKEQFGSLEVECASEDQSCERARSKIADLRNREHERGKLLDAGKNEVSKQKTVLLNNLLDNNAVLRSLIASTREKLRSHGILHTLEADDCAIATTAVETDGKEEVTWRAELDQLQAREADASSKRDISLEEAKKLGQNLDETLKESGKLDLIADDLQTQYNAIIEWYSTLEDWNKDGKCPSCDIRLDVCAMVDAKLKESNASETDSNAPQSASSTQVDM